MAACGRAHLASVPRTRDGFRIIGLRAGPRTTSTIRDGWTCTQSDGLQLLPNFPVVGARGGAVAISDDGRIITDFSDLPGFPTTRVRAIWTSELGTSPNSLFLSSLPG